MDFDKPIHWDSKLQMMINHSVKRVVENADIDVLFQDPQMGPGIKDGQIRRAFDITFTVRCEFNTVGYFMLNCPDIEKQIFVPVLRESLRMLLMLTEFSPGFNLKIGHPRIVHPIGRSKSFKLITSEKIGV